MKQSKWLAPRWRFGRVVLALFVAVLASSAAGLRAAGPQTMTPVTFALDRVEDRYAINLPGFRDLFRLFDVGYAGCSIALDINVDRTALDADSNRKIEVTLDVALHRPVAPFKWRTVGSLERRQLEIYLGNRCDEVDRVAILGVQCFDGQHAEFAGLSCPYRFQPGAYAIRRFYLGDDRT
jgi:hypothetical protein